MKEIIHSGGGAGIRTLGGVTPTTVFETVPFSRSGTPPAAHTDTNKYNVVQPQFNSNIGFSHPDILKDTVIIQAKRF